MLTVLLAVAGAFVACLAAAAALAVGMRVSARREADARRELHRLPLALLGGFSPACPSGRLRRRVARDLMLAADGVPSDRVAAWLTDNGFVAEGLALLRSRVPSRRVAGAAVLGAIGARRAEGALIVGLDDPRERVRDACAAALGHMAGPRGALGLVLALERGRVPEGVAASALTGVSRDADPVLEAALRERGAPVRALIARVLATRGAARHAGALLGGLADPDPAVRAGCAGAIGRLDPLAVPGGTRTALVDLTIDAAPAVRSAAGTALGRLFPAQAEPALRRLAEDADFWVGFRAAEAISRLPNADAVGWAVLEDDRGDEAGERARVRCLQWLQRTGGIERRLADCMAAGGAGLADAMAVLRRAGATAWAGPA